MKRYALIRLEYGANKVLAESAPCDFKTALDKFQSLFSGALDLDERGYAKLNDMTSFCIAEYHENFSPLL